MLFSQILPDAPVRLTHLDMGTPVQLQLVQPLVEDHPLIGWLNLHGEGLHHLCFKVDDVATAMNTLPVHNLPLRDKAPRCGPNGGSAAFLDPAGTRGVLLEITSDPGKQ